MNYYVLACETGREKRNIILLKNTVELLYPGAYLKAWSPVRESKEFCAKTWTMKLRSILPGYIIIVCDRELWRIQKDIFLMSETCYGFLKNLDHSYELKGTDRHFAQWIEENDGLIKASKVIMDRSQLKPDDRITVISGPMKNIEGRIVNIYKNVRVQVEVKFLNEIRKLTLPIEVVEFKGETPQNNPKPAPELAAEGEKDYFVSDSDY